MNVDVRAECLDILSICTGGAGLDLGIELAIPGARAVCMVEREAFAIAHLVSAMEKGLLAPAPIWSNARTFDGSAWRGRVDGLIGGIPCQPHSLAGKKRGKLDDRDLWSPARRVIVQARPWFVLIENVAGMISPGDDKISGAERVWRDLQKLGFSVEGGLFAAAEVGAPHERERVFILGVANAIGGLPDWRRSGPFQSSRCATESETQGQDRQWCWHDTGDGGQCVADAFSEGLEGRERHAARQRVEGGSAQRDSESLVDADCTRWPQAGSGYPFDARRQSEPGCGALVDSSSNGRRKGRTEPRIKSRHGLTTALTSAPMDDATRGDRHLHSRPRQDRIREADIGGAIEGLPAFPPGPADFDAWRRVLSHSPDLEPSVRRMADGVAARVDLSGPHAGRVDRLRMLGNGVVSLEGAHAFRTLCHRLADRGSAGATRLVRMMMHS